MHSTLWLQILPFYLLHYCTISVLWNAFRQHGLVEKLYTMNFSFGFAIK